MIPARPAKGRLAPSPTGALHVGNARTFLAAWLAARSSGGGLVLRVEDLEKPAAGVVLEEMLSDLAWLGFDWDEGPVWGPDDEAALAEWRRYPKTRPAAARRQADLAAGASMADWPSPTGRLIRAAGAHGPYIQSRRGDSYRALFEELRRRELIYPCVCSRADYAAAAPHAGDNEARYPGTCRGRFADAGAAQAWLDSRRAEAERSGRAPPPLRQPVWRFRTPAGVVEFVDAAAGHQSFDAAGSVGDFVAFKTPEQPSYQMAVVADDLAMGVGQVVRGDDLLPSTARQILLYRALGAEAPAWLHVPLVVGPDGKRIAKRHGDSRIRQLREQGADPRRIVGVLAAWSGWGDATPRRPSDLLSAFDPARIPRRPVVLDAARWAELAAGFA